MLIVVAGFIEKMNSLLIFMGFMDAEKVLYIQHRNTKESRTECN
jgi:hypothetical protein